MRLLVDASAAIGIASREGIGRIRHVDVAILWLQQKELKKQLEVLKVAGTENPSDLLTKHVDRRLCEEHVGRLGCRFADGRADSAMQLLSVRRVKGQSTGEICRSPESVKSLVREALHRDHGWVESAGQAGSGGSWNPEFPMDGLHGPTATLGFPERFSRDGIPVSG